MAAPTSSTAATARSSSPAEPAPTPSSSIDRTTQKDIWTTILNFHKDDAVTIFGVSQGAFDIGWFDDQGWPGFTGLTLHGSAPGHANVSVTLPGFTTADLSNGKLSTSFGTETYWYALLLYPRQRLTGLPSRPFSGYSVADRGNCHSRAKATQAGIRATASSLALTEPRFRG